MSGFPVVREFLHNEALRIGFIGLSHLRQWELGPAFLLLNPMESVPFTIALNKAGNEEVVTSTEIVF